MKNDLKVPTFPRLSIVSYYFGTSLCLFIYLIVNESPCFI